MFLDFSFPRRKSHISARDENGISSFPRLSSAFLSTYFNFLAATVNSHFSDLQYIISGLFCDCAGKKKKTFFGRCFLPVPLWRCKLSSSVNILLSILWFSNFSYDSGLLLDSFCFPALLTQCASELPFWCDLGRKILIYISVTRFQLQSFLIFSLLKIFLYILFPLFKNYTFWAPLIFVLDLASYFK